MGFLFANFFGIITSTKSVIFVFIMCIELINCLVYTRNSPLRQGKPKAIFTFGLRKAKLRPEDDLKMAQRKSYLIETINKKQRITVGNTVRLNAQPLPHTPYPKGVQGYRGTAIKYSFSKNGFAKQINHVFIYVLTILNFLKIGFEFGFFVDAFKLGS